MFRLADIFRLPAQKKQLTFAYPFYFFEVFHLKIKMYSIIKRRDYAASMPEQNQGKQTDSALEQTLQELFGNQTYCSPLSTPMHLGRRVHGIDLKETLSGATRAPR